MSYLVITNCTGRKSISPSIGLKKSPKISKIGQIQDAANNWAQVVRSDKNKIEAKDLYQGRTIVDTKSVQEHLDADVYVISAGLGLVNFEEPIPSYELTVNEDSQFSKSLKRFGHSNQDWWAALNKSLKKTSNPISRLLAKNSYKRILISLPSSYLEMISDDLWSADPRQLKKILIFTSPYGTTFIPEQWRHLGLPYDERLEDRKSGYSGTRSDFPQRAMKHFAKEIGKPNESLPKIIKLLNTKLSKLKKPVAPNRAKISDPELIRLINKNWKKFDGQTSKLLRFLRDEALVSCEQSRFQKICSEIRESRNEIS
jgi:hypothetical protein